MRAIQPFSENDSILHATDATFTQDIERSDLPVLVDFWAPWCAPCRAMGETLERVAPELNGRVRIVKVNVDENPAVAQRFSVMSIPTLVFFEKGEALGMIPGALPEEPLRQALEMLAEGRLDELAGK